MAKKVTIESLKDELSKLEAQEQNAAVMEKIDSLKSRIETMEAEDKALVEEIARNEAEKAAKKAKKDDDDDKKEVDFEEWKLERSVIQGQVRYERVKKIKECKMLKEHADELNLQKENRLFEYIKIK